jgi:hypothetical protein
MLVRECFGDQQDGNRGKQNAHRPNENSVELLRL